MVDFGSFKQGSNELNTQKYHMTSLFCMNVGMLRFVPTYELWGQILSEVGFLPDVISLEVPLSFSLDQPVTKNKQLNTKFQCLHFCSNPTFF